MPSRKARLATSLLACLSASAAHAATTTWTNLSGGSWGTPGNWNAAPTFAADDILDFSTLNITANATTTLDGARSAGQLRFGDATTASHDWVVNTGTGGALTLATTTGTPVILVNNRTATINAALNGSQGFQKTGAGALVLAGTNGYSGPTTVAAGQLTFNNAASLYGGNTANWTAANLTANSGATLNFRVGGAGEITANQFTTILLPNLTTGLNNNGLKAGSTLAIDTSNLGGTITLSNALADTTGTGGGLLNFTKSGNNTLAFTGTNTLTGLITAAGGTVNVSGNQSAATGGWNLRGNATVNFNAGSTITVASGKTINLVNDSSATHTLNVAGTVTGTGSLKLEAGSVLNINSGAVWTQSGAMTIQPNSSFSTPVMNVNTGGAFTYTGSGAISLSSSTAANDGGATLNLSGGTFTTGKNFVNASNGTSTNAASVAKLTFSNGGTLKLSADITSLATITNAGRSFQVQLGSGGGKIDTNGFSTEITLPITGAGSLEKLGDGTLTLSGPDSYSGGTTVTAGTLLVNGNTTGTGLVSVTGATATLGGTGSIAGAVDVTGILAPGASIATFATGALTMNEGSTFKYEATSSNTTGADLMIVNGALSLDGVTLDLSGADLSLGSWQMDDKLTLISYSGGPITSGFTGYDDDTTYFFGGNQWLFNYDDTGAGDNFAAEANGSRFVTMTFVPEPSAALLGGLGLLALLRRRRS